VRGKSAVPPSGHAPEDEIFHRAILSEGGLTFNRLRTIDKNDKIKRFQRDS
jgi:hypothetical protein